MENIQAPIENVETVVDTPEQSIAEPSNVKPTYKVKIDGQEQELDIDTILKDYQTSQSAQKRFTEASQMRRQVEQVLEMLNGDDWHQVFKQLGKDPVQLAEQLIYQQMEEEKLSPEQRELKKYKEWEAEIKRQTEEYQKQEEQARLTAEQQKWHDHYEKQFVEALQTTNIPKTAKTVGDMAYYIKTAMANGIELTPKEAAELVKKQYQNDINELLAQLPEETLLELLGENVAGKIRKADLKRLKTPTKPEPTKVTTSSSAAKQPKKAKSLEEFFHQKAGR